MADPSEKLAESLEVLREAQERRGASIRSRYLSRTHRERLLQNGFLQKVMKGWYIPARPDEAVGGEHGMVRLLLGFLRRLSEQAVRRELVSFSGTIAPPARRKLAGAATIAGARLQRRQQARQSAPRHILV